MMSGSAPMTGPESQMTEPACAAPASASKVPKLGSYGTINERWDLILGCETRKYEGVARKLERTGRESEDSRQELPLEVPRYEGTMHMLEESAPMLEPLEAAYECSGAVYEGKGTHYK